MAEVKATKTRDGVLLSGSVPAGLLSAASLDITQLRDGSFLLTPKKAQREGWALGSEEKALLRKLLSIRFEKRVPAAVNPTLSTDEMKVLDGLMRKKAVQILHGGKYAASGVYSLSEFAFHQAREEMMGQAAKAQQAEAAIPISSPEHLEKFGWMVIEGEKEARDFSNSFADRVRSGAVAGVRAFDRKFYFVTPAFLRMWEKKVAAALARGEKTVEEISSELALSADGCRCLLYHMCEAGDVLEKHRGKFAKA